jgi:hypothetical protein
MPVTCCEREPSYVAVPALFLASRWAIANRSDELSEIAMASDYLQ